MPTHRDLPPKADSTCAVVELETGKVELPHDPRDGHCIHCGRAVAA